MLLLNNEHAIMIGIVGFSFGLRTAATEPGPCNQRLGRVIQRIVQVDLRDLSASDIAVVAQWEIAKQLEHDGIAYQVSVQLHNDGSYLDTRAVWEAAKVYFAELGITQVIPVAQPYLHMPYIKKMIRDDGFTIISKPMERIGFDNSPLNTQPWTRNWLAFTWKVFKIAAFGDSHGHKGKQTT